MSKVGVIGNGFVGSAVANGFSHCDVKIFDKNPENSTHSLKEVIDQDFVFVCVPTPMTSVTGGACNLSIIDSCFREINDIGSDAIFIIKSTVPIGTTAALQEGHPNLSIIHSPEFLTAKFAKEDFINADRHILGHPNGESQSQAISNLLNLFNSSFPETPCLVMSSHESEAVKYIANCFLATKVSFFNEIFLLIEKLGIDWQKILEGVVSDSRIGNSHYQVPGHDGDKGFGGTCFPKDINALIKTFESHDIQPKLLRTAWEVNLDVRGELDWGKSSSAVDDSVC